MYYNKPFVHFIARVFSQFDSAADIYSFMHNENKNRSLKMGFIKTLTPEFRPYSDFFI